MIIVWVTVVVVAVSLFVWKKKAAHSYWKNVGVPQNSKVPFLGESVQVLLGSGDFLEMIKNAYNARPDVRYFGTYQFFDHLLCLRDPDLIKLITVKDFDHFMDHRPFLPEEGDVLWAKNLFALRGEKWKDMRAAVSPSFTSNKIKIMFSLIKECAQNLSQHFLKKEGDIHEIELKDTFTKFTNDAIATAAFGVKCDSLEDPKNEFYIMAQDATRVTGFWPMLKMFLVTIFPKISKYVKFQIFPKRLSDFFRNLVSESIKYRQENNIVRPDLINVLMEARKDRQKLEIDPTEQSAVEGFSVVHETSLERAKKLKKFPLSDDDITAQAVIFFFAGFDTVSTLLSFIGYEMALNPEVQKRLQKEVDGVLLANNGELTYDSLLGMKYLDMVVSETLRKWPPAPAVDRICVKSYTIQPVHPEERPVEIKVNDVVWIPTFALHRDPKYFPNPDLFDPERFNDENKSSVNPYVYQPFGSGPRSCVGSRFALLEIKALYFYLMANFDLVKIDKTEVPLQMAKRDFNMMTKNGIWVGLKKRLK